MTINKFLINVLKQFNGTYLETGLSEGDSLAKAKELNFKKLISIEINQKYVDKCRIRFSNDIKVGKIELVNQNSASALDLILKKNNDIDVVFLDAHFHGEGQEYAPLDQEIEILIKNNYKKLVIIDDFFHIKKKMAHEWTKFHNHQTIKQKILKNFGKVSELPYSFKGRYNSYLISMEFSKARILIEKIKAIILSSPKNLIKIFMGKKLN